MQKRDNKITALDKNQGLFTISELYPVISHKCVTPVVGRKAKTTLLIHSKPPKLSGFVN